MTLDAAGGDPGDAGGADDDAAAQAGAVAAADENGVLREWVERVWDCPTGAELLGLVAARPGRPAVVGARFVVVPGEPVLPTGRAEFDKTEFDETAPTAAVRAARAHNAQVRSAGLHWANILLESVQARQRLISWLHAGLAADLAGLAADYPGVLTQLSGEVGMALRITDAEAGRLLHLGQRLDTELPLTRAALASGVIAVEVATAVHDATGTVTPAVAAAVEARVIPEAPGLTRRQTYRRCQQLIALLDPDQATDRHRWATQRRGVWRELGADGMARMTLYGPAPDVAGIWTATHLLGAAAGTPGDDRTPGQRRFDALVHVTEDILTTGHWEPHHPSTSCGAHPTTDRTSGTGIAGPTDRTGGADPTDPTGEISEIGSGVGSAVAGSDGSSGGGHLGGGGHSGGGCHCTGDRARRPRTRSPVLINVHVTLDTLLGVQHTPGWVDGFGAVDAATTRRIAGDATWRRIVTDPLSGTVLDVGRTRYRPPAALAEHIQLRDLTCRRPGCDQPAAHCDLDHQIPYRPGHSTGGSTSAGQLRVLCRHHHLGKDGGGCHLTQNPDQSWTWTTALDRGYTRPHSTIFDPGDDQPSTPEYYTNKPIPRWARTHTTSGNTTQPDQHQPPGQPTTTVTNTNITDTADDPPF
jgi:hypothetical protein